jgi:hypothetical protein
MHGSVVSRNGGTPAIESPGNAEAWLRTRSPAALALVQLARDEVHLWRVELDATSPQFAQDMRLMLSQTKGRKPTVCTVSQDWRTFIVRYVLGMLLGGYLAQDSGRLRFCYGPHGNLASTWIQNESTSASHSLAISPFWSSRHPAPFRCCPPISKPDGYRRSATHWIRLRGMGSVLKGRVAVS